MSKSRSERVVIGYVADDRGYDALALGVFLSRGTARELIITMVMPEPNYYGGNVGSFNSNDQILAEQLQQWSRDALARIPEDVPARVELRYASSDVHGILDSVAEHDASLVVIGAKGGPVIGAFSIGTVANALLHSSPVPVALAPVGFSQADQLGPVGRVTGVFGTRPGSEAVIGRSVQRAVERNVPLRLVSLVQVDQASPREIREVTDEVREFGGRKLEEIAVGMLDSGRAHIEIAEGRDFEDALAQVEWRSDEMAIIGSSRLGRNSVFMGSRARRILRAIEVPVVVIPRDYQGPVDHRSPTSAIPIIVSDFDENASGAQQ